MDVLHLFSRKLRRKGENVTLFSQKFLGHTFFSEISRPCAPYIRLHLRVFFFAFDYFDHNIIALIDFEFFCFEDLPDMLERCRAAQIKDKHLNLNLETSLA